MHLHPSTITIVRICRCSGTRLSNLLLLHAHPHRSRRTTLQRPLFSRIACTRKCPSAPALAYPRLSTHQHAIYPFTAPAALFAPTPVCRVGRGFGKFHRHLYLRYETQEVHQSLRPFGSPGSTASLRDRAIDLTNLNLLLHRNLFPAMVLPASCAQDQLCNHLTPTGKPNTRVPAGFCIGQISLV